MSRFKPLSVKSLPRVMVAILAMDPDDREMIAQALYHAPKPQVLFGTLTIANMPQMFHEILQLPKEQRAAYVDAMNFALDDLRRQDAFGTEGQLDPRGDDR